MPENMPDTPREWLQLLLPLLNEQAQEAEFYRRYYAGVHRISNATERFKQIFGRFFPNAADNWMQVVVDSSVERLGIQGIRFGGPESKPDDQAWAIFQRNKLDLKQVILHTEAVKCGKAFLLVDPTPPEGARITVESPTEVYVLMDPETDERLAAVKRWWGADKHAYCILYLPDRVYRFRSAGKVRSLTGKPTWQPLEGFGAEEGDLIGSVPNELKKVPMIPVANNPDILYGGVSDLQVVVPIQDRVNKLCLDLDVGSEFHAAPQRWATGWEPPTDEEGNPLPEAQIKSATSRFLAFHNENAKVGQLPAGEPRAYVEPIEMYVQHIAALSRTPPHYLLGRMANLSGDALKAAETGLVAKTLAKQLAFSDPWEEALAMATGKTGEAAEQAEIIWKDPESRTFGQLVDGVVKLRQELALPLEMGWEMIGLSPQQIARAKKLIGLPDRDFQALDRGLAMQQREAAERERLGQQDPNRNGGDPQRDAAPGGREAQPTT